jgi:hypothetical protein
MRPGVSLFDQAADKLREAMEGPVSGADRMRLIHECLALYHRHQDEAIEDAAAGEAVLPFEGA